MTHLTENYYAVLIPEKYWTEVHGVSVPKGFLNHKGEWTADIKQNPFSMTAENSIGIASESKRNTMTNNKWRKVVGIYKDKECIEGFFVDYQNKKMCFFEAVDSGISLLASKGCYLTCPEKEPQYDFFLAYGQDGNSMEDTKYKDKLDQYNKAMKATGDYLIIKTVLK